MLNTEISYRLATILSKASSERSATYNSTSVYDGKNIAVCKALSVVPQRRVRSGDVLAVLADLFVEHGPPEHISFNNGPEFAAKAVRAWLARVSVKTLFIEPGSPWENGCIATSY